MQKIKYIIIFVLLLALGMFYTQIVDYQSITNSLLKENQTHNSSNTNLQDKLENLQNKIQSLQNEKKDLQHQVKTLQQTLLTVENSNKPLKEKIISLEEELLSMEIKLQKASYLVPEGIKSQEIVFDNNSLKIPAPPKSSFYNGPDLTPSVGLDEQHNVTGMGLEYKTKF